MSRSVLAMLIAAPILISTAAQSAPNSLAPDLDIEYSCTGSPPSDGKIESFLGAHGFEVANPERVRRQFGAGFFPMEIEAMDRKRRQVEFRGISNDPSAPNAANTLYTVAVFSPPPTLHDAAFEDALIAFVAGESGCETRSTARSDNATDAAAMFSFTADLERKRMHEAAICDRTEPTYDRSACANVPGVKELHEQHP